MYQVGETVFYGTEGVCRVEEIREMKVNREAAEYYVLRPVYREGSTVFVPVQNELLVSRMRPLLTRKQIEKMIDKVNEKDEDWIDDASERKAAFQQILLSGDRQELLSMVRVLYLRRHNLQTVGKRLRTNDEQMLRDAQKLLDDEFSVVLGIKPREVPEYIRSKLKE
ncbi:MAG: CarD family transcriptional regulator [Oscillospiraceae bacterium]|nr:CarD family transcriptional regulator [Oscillospiraceae bacterium]